jgi:hypothetical protein
LRAAHFSGAGTAQWAFIGIVAYRDDGATAVELEGLLRMARPRSWARACCRGHTEPDVDQYLQVLEAFMDGMAD